MKYLITLTIGVCLLFPAVPAMADLGEDEAAVRKAWEQSQAAFNNHDAKMMAALSDQSNESWDGNRKWTAGADHMADLFKRQPSIKSKRLEEIGIIFFTPDVAVYKALMDNTGLVDEDGNPLPQVKWLGAWVMVKKNGKWLSAAFFTRLIEE
ncbi:hypothetical protein E3V55_03660 [Candidatus Marinimicrobia bacterium MT.SAG.3]|nr:hypothetical protein E3V55_03660 [Candidatus Marinimicrobia bacterium MT.SAG.3]